MNRKAVYGMLVILVLTGVSLQIQPVRVKNAYTPEDDNKVTPILLPTPLNQSIPIGLKEPNDEIRNSSESWIPFKDVRVPRPPKVEILGSDKHACVITIDTYGMHKDQVEAQEGEFQKFRIPNHGFTNEPGKPQLPAIRGLIETPLDKSVSLTITTLRSLELLNYTAYPAQEPIPESSEEVNKGPLQINQSVYSMDAYYPHSLVSISSPAQLRNRNIVQLNVYPIRFNPAVHSLNVSTSVTIKLEYHDMDKPQTTSFNRLSSTAFDEICRTSVWNYDFSKPEAVELEPIGYLVISNDTFFSSMIPFVEWKTANGFNVTSVKLSEIGLGVSDTDIYNYIFNAYHNWATPPTYVLLVGDVEYLPTHYGLDHPYESRKTATDHYYACVSGSDYLPDLFVGRLSVKSVSELNNSLNKLIGYNGFFDKRATLVSDTAHFEDTSNWIYNFLTAEGYTADRLYTSLGKATTSNIASALNDGRSIINYRGHGSPTGWATGSFYNSDVLGLSNEGKPPIVISCTCSTGEYDYASDSFGETWIKAQGKGAVAFWGSSRVSYSGYNDELSKGVYKAVFDDGLNEFGPITVRAKLYMYNHYGDEFYTHLEYEMFNILTDPQLSTSPFLPHELEVSLDSPNFVTLFDEVLLNATVFNLGFSNETNVELFLKIDGDTVNFTTIPELPAKSSHTTSYPWIPTTEGIYNVTAYTPPVPDESYTWNNVLSANVTVSATKGILIVADDNGGSKVRGTSLPEFESALVTAGFDYFVWNESSMGNPPLEFLMNFKLVIWTCGDYYNGAVDSVDAATLESYLVQGGNILLEGEDIGYDHRDDGFMVNVAHAIYQIDNTGAPGLTVTEPTHPVVNGLPLNFTWDTDPPYDDGVTPTNTGMKVIQYTGTSWTAVTVSEGTISKVAYYAFPLYCLGNPEQETLATSSVNWLLEPPRASSWVEDRQVSGDPFPVDEKRPVMATDSNGHLYIAYEHHNSESEFYGIYVSKSMDGGNTWSTIGSTVDTHKIANPSIAIDVGDNNNIFVAFEREWTPTDHDIFVLRYVGGSWDVFTVVNMLGSDDRYPSITSEYQYGTSDWQYISYEYVYSHNDRDLMFAKSADDGATWTIAKLHGSWPDNNVHSQTSITTTRGSGGNDYIYIAYKWGADYTTAYDIVIDKSEDWGNTWTQQWICDESSRDKSWPSITATHGGDAVVIAWHVYWDSIYLNDVQYAYSTNNGDSWYVRWLALEAYINEETPTLTVDGQGSTSSFIRGNIHATYWRDNQIYYLQASFNSPESWTVAEAVTDAAAHVSAVYTKPTITTYRSVGGRYVPAVAWTDFRNGNYDIYHSTKDPIYTIYIRADGSVDPPIAPISSVDNVTYSFTDDVYYSIAVERDDIVVDGRGYTVKGPAAQWGIPLSGVENVTIKNMEIEGFQYGVRLEQSSNNSVFGSKIRDNWCGIWIQNSSNNIISEDTVESNTYGVWIFASDNTVYRNIIANSSSSGVVVDLNSSNNTVTENKIIGNTIGVWLIMASDNRFYHNNFIDNTQPVSIPILEYANSWDNGYPSGGNYWSDYVGVDEKRGSNQDQPGGDGLGDTLYIILGNNTDNYPLIGPWTPPDIAATSITLSKTIVSQGYNMSINVTVENQGNKVEGLNVTACANATAVQTQYIILQSQNSTTVTFTWNTTGFPKGNYTISAYATPLPGETDIADNTRVDGTVLVTHAFSASIYTDKYTYSENDTMYLGVGFANLNGEANACIEILLVYPDGSTGTLLHQHDVTVPAFYSYGKATFSTMVLPLMPVGVYHWQIRILDPTTHTVIVEDDAEWEYTHPSQFWVEIYTDKYTYSENDTMYLGVGFANLNGEANACIEILLVYPDGSTGTLLHEHNVTVPELYSYGSAAFKAFLMPDMPVGVCTWYIRVLDPATHAVIVEDTAEWEFI